ncbi:MAG: endonuclease/exonuclease/phosphatase family protein [Leptolyngbya sp. SIO1E4]|nr:endonuclease/exonuclease/phosphatase family protein [Leptolyngbya sp. SIO1E4]
MTLWLLLRSQGLGHLWGIGVLNYIAIYLFIPLPVLLIAALWFRQWRLGMGLGIPTLAFCLLYGAFFLPSLPHPPSPGQAITVMTFNVRLGNQDALPLVQVIRAEQPDIVGLQEFTPQLLRALTQALADDYPHKALVLEQPGLGAVGILSKFPVKKSVIFSLPGHRSGVRPNTGKAFSPPGSRLGIRATIQISDQRIQVVSVDGVHNPTLGEPFHQWPATARKHYAQKTEEIRRLEEQLRQESDPFLLLCDCNLVDTSEFYARLSSFAHDSFRKQGWGLGHTLSVQVGYFSLAAGQRIDYIWHSDEFTALRAWVGHDGGSSDHFPVLAKFVLTK